MSLKLGTQDIAGVSQNTKYNAHHLLDFKWTDCIMNDVSWLRADTFSWQSGGVYVSAYNHLVADLQGTTAETETIGSYTVTFYRATDGHKIVLADMETTVANIYSETGIAWYYILDTTNTRFKFPRTKYGFEGLRTNVGDNINESLPNITGSAAGSRDTSNTKTGVFSGSSYSSTSYAGHSGASGYEYHYDFNASNSSSTYQDNAPVQERATQMYLYFYVGDYSQTAIEQTAGLNSELFNGKADVDLNNVSNTSGFRKLVDIYNNGTSWYKVYNEYNPSTGAYIGQWCEQGGITGGYSGTSVTINLLKTMKDTNYLILIGEYFNASDTDGGGNTPIIANYPSQKTTSSFYVSKPATYYIGWQVCGYIN